jgi:hypothetical protein
MPDYIPIFEIGSSNTDIKAIASSDAVDFGRIKECETTFFAGSIKFWATNFYTQHQTTAEREFEEQKKLFELIPPLLLEQYRGQFVASKDGQVVDSDESFETLAHRFFATFGDVPAYLTKIGEDPGITIDTPFF